MRREIRTAGKAAAWGMAVVGLTSVLVLLGGCGGGSGGGGGQPFFGHFIAFASDRPGVGGLDIYLWDPAVSEVVLLPNLNSHADEREPTITPDGRFIAFTSNRNSSDPTFFDIFLYDRQIQQLVDLPNLNSEATDREPSLTADGRFIAFSSPRPGGVGGWDIYLYDRQTQQFLDLPNLNTPDNDRLPSITPDGRFISFASPFSISEAQEGLTDIFLYDRQTQRLVDLPNLNLPGVTEAFPSISGDGNLIAFASDRPGGAGGFDIYLYDRSIGGLVHLTNINTDFDEAAPSITADGRFIAFVTFGADLGGLDIALYDRQRNARLPTRGLNSVFQDGIRGVATR